MELSRLIQNQSVCMIRLGPQCFQEQCLDGRHLSAEGDAKREEFDETSALHSSRPF